MKTTIDIPEKQLKDAMNYAGVNSKKEAVNIAISEYNRRKAVEDLIQDVRKGGINFLSNEELEAQEDQHAL